MKKFDRDGLLLCEIQGKLFETSVTYLEMSSEVFVRRFMNSKKAKQLDSAWFLDSTETIYNIFEDLDKEYGPTTYGSVKYHHDVMFWCGYMYRYFCYTYDISSKRAYKYIPLKFIASTYPAYHTLGCDQAIELLLEARGIDLSIEGLIKKGVQLLKEMKLNEI